MMNIIGPFIMLNKRLDENLCNLWLTAPGSHDKLRLMFTVALPKREFRLPKRPITGFGWFGLGK
jgi:hypothetical protein